MSLSTTQLALLVLSLMVVIAVISFFLGKRKTNSPIKAAALGFIFTIVPVLGIIYVIYLANKEDIVNN